MSKKCNILSIWGLRCGNSERGQTFSILGQHCHLISQYCLLTFFPPYLFASLNKVLDYFTWSVMGRLTYLLLLVKSAIGRPPIVTKVAKVYSECFLACCYAVAEVLLSGFLLAEFWCLCLHCTQICFAFQIWSLDSLMGWSFCKWNLFVEPV